MNSRSQLSVKREAILQMSDNRKNELNNFIINNMGTPFHEVHFNCIASECFNTNAIYLIAYKESEIVGVCPMHYFSNGIAKIGFSNLVSYEIPYGGWIYNKDEVSIRELIKCLKVGWNEKFVYRSNIIMDDNSNDYKGFIPMETVIVDLKRDIDDIFSGLNRKTRNKIRRAIKIGVRIRYLSMSELGEFIRISRELKKRTRQPFYKEFYYKVFEKYSTEHRIQCSVAEYNNEIISGGILIANKNFSIGWIPGRKTDIPNNLYQNELLFWDHIVWSKKNNIQYFDLCGLNQKRLPHLARIKLSFSGDIKKFYAKNYNRVIYKILSTIRQN
ncbi:MAG: GNAT family N-acetyltransferase [Promethearchaeota archaeon]